ncbi:ABC transporter permease [Tessaracoccus flavescens]|uniref:ABC transporter permease n=1 Tax=Tessaracoccus flavescens TaxID=399497 RepID=A0A1Q2CZ82_9ACTN|nr:FtsX-like permease family protein [Tessaracoccus flavescens]AQP51392.1 hypothetical protein BW733_11765 [Tessaracoccus flavescens]
MWRQAISELRLHPSRFIATLIAIAISVGFISAISVFVNSQQTALGNQGSLDIVKADIVVDGTPESAKVIAATEGVEDVVARSYPGVAFLSKGERSINASLYEVPPQWLRWSEIVEGRMPEKSNEVAISRDGLESLGAKVGDTLSVEMADSDLTVVGATDDPGSLFSQIGYRAPDPASETPPDDEFGPVYVSYAVKVSDPGSIDATVDALAKALPKDDAVASAEQVRVDQLNQMTAEFDVFKNLLQAFAAIALLVGAITIANTFTILVAQRRRQIALLRAVGASPGQVMGRLVVESFLLGAIGSLIGIGVGFLVAWLGGMVTGSNFWGLTVRPLELVVAWGAGVLATMVAAIAPSVAATRVKPLEALQSVPTEAQAKRAGIVRVIVCAFFAVIGIGLAVLSQTVDTVPIVWAIGAGIAFTIAVLGAAPLYVAPLLRLLARVFGPIGPTTRLALTNAARNPRRAASTATALMLAVGLIVTLQVALATSRSSGMEAIDRQYPIDLTISSREGEVSTSLIDDLRGQDSVADVIEIQSKRIEGEFGPTDFSTPSAAYSELGIEPPSKAKPADDEIVLYAFGSTLTTAEEGDTVTVQGSDGPLQLKVKTDQDLPGGSAVVSPATFAKIAGAEGVRELWVKLVDRDSASQLSSVMRTVQGHNGAEISGGGAIMASTLSQVLDVLLIVMTALLGVAVLIALVGVGNTLGLSVLERQRESALLRALGMQRSGLRAMLLIEAIALVAIGAVIGLLAGMFFGWLGVSSTLRMIPDGAVNLRFSLDWLYTVGLVLVCLLAAVLASILPGRRAANATPTEALAVD